LESGIVDALADGTLSPVIDKEFPLAEIKGAHELVESNTSIGKVLLRVI
jgi:NADPH2:quinone reductase